jgi:hypothetical protein
MKSSIINSNEQRTLEKNPFHCISQFMVFKIFQNCLLLYQWHHTTFYGKKITQLSILVDIMNP